MPAGILNRVMTMALIALILGAGLCLFDGDDGTAGDLCISLLTPAIGLLLAFPLAPTGRLLPARVQAYHPYLPDLPAPPPKP